MKQFEDSQQMCTVILNQEVTVICVLVEENWYRLLFFLFEEVSVIVLLS